MASASPSKLAAFFTYADAVFDTQEQLTPDATKRTLAAAIAKAGLDRPTSTACAATPATKASVQRLHQARRRPRHRVDPHLVVNGRPLPLGGDPV